ncbi:MAG: alpha/beta hydrolase family esterase, partial [Planctomycetaceae bacterium]
VRSAISSSATDRTKNFQDTMRQVQSAIKTRTKLLATIATLLLLAAVWSRTKAASIDAMIDRISATWVIDRDRIFVTGFSNGASMTFRLGAELSHRVAAIAPVAGTCWIKKPKPANALSLCYITGAADSLNPIEGGYPKLAFGGKEQGGQPKPAVQTFIDEWAAALHCPQEPRGDETSNGIHKRLYGPGRHKAEVMVITVEGLGHHWPGGISQAPQFLLGKPSKKLSATDVIWEFFRSHPGVRVSAVPAG